MKPEFEKPAPVSGRELMGLAALMTVALLLRLEHLETLFPWFLFLDETRTTGVSLFLLRNSTLDTSFTFYPAFGFYIHAAGQLAHAFTTNLGAVTGDGGETLRSVISGISAEAPETIIVSRCISLVFAMGALVFTHLLARQYLGWKWALVCTLFLALNSMHISISTLAKVDAINLFWICAAYYTGVKYWRGGRSLKWLVAAGVFTGLVVVTKYNYQLCLFVGLLTVLNALEEKGSWRRLAVDTLGFPLRWIKGKLGGEGPVLRDAEAHLWIFVVLIFAASFIGSPYSYIHARETLVSLGWIYKHGEIISTYHSDPHVWWLDRFYYLITIVLPFIFGLPLFWIMAGALVHHVRKYALIDPFIMFNFIWFIYFLGSQSGGDIGGSFPYYLFLNIVPLGILIALDALKDLCRSDRPALRVAGVALFLVVLVTGVLRADSYRSVFYEGHERLGAYLEKRAGDDDHMLLVSVYKPRDALGKMHKLSIWPHQVKRPGEAKCDIMESGADNIYMDRSIPGAGSGLCGSFAYRPEILVVDNWLLAGFRKVYRDMWVAPYWDRFLEEEKGYRVIKRIRPDYFNRAYYAGLDPEHDVEIVVLEKKKEDRREGGE